MTLMEGAEILLGLAKSFTVVFTFGFVTYYLSKCCYSLISNDDYHNQLYECSSCHRYVRQYQKEGSWCRCGGELKETKSYPWMDVHAEFPVLTTSQIKKCERLVEEQEQGRRAFFLYQGWAKFYMKPNGAVPSVSEEEVLEYLNLQKDKKIITFEDARKHLGYPY